MFDLYAKISLDSKEYEKNLGDAKSKFSGFADGLKGAVGKVGDVLAGIGKAATVGVGAAGAALTSLTKQSLDAVANYEQLVGGVDKIFGESSKKVQEYANQAFVTAGLSANDYMETVTGFSASLLQSLSGDTEKAADTANRAIIDMADNMNTYGSSMDSVQNAYQGFAKQNYTMLDNLKLGYGGTKEEMQRLIVDASEMTDEMKELGVTVDADSMSFGNIINAISVMQKHLKISGTTSKEAAGTISGSVASMKAAWQNFLTGTGSPAQFSEVLKSSVGNISNQLDEIIPRLADGLTELVDAISPEIPPIIEKTLPSVISGSSKLMTGLAERLPELLETTLPALSQGVIDVSVALVGVMPELITSLKKSIPIVVNTIMEKKDDLLQAGKDMIAAIFPSEISGDSLKKIVDSGFNIVGKLVENITSEKTLDQITNPDGATVKIIGAIGEGLVEFAINLVDSAREVIKNLGDYLNDEENRKQLFESAKEILVKIGKGLTSQEAKDAVGGLIVESAKFLADTFIGGIDWDATGGQIAEQIVSGIYNNFWTTRLGTMIGEALSDATHGMELDYLEEGAGTYNASRHATGFYANRPTWLSNSIVGESGDEVLLPLDSNTEWMDKLADKLGNKMNGGIYITVNAPTGNAEDIVDAIDIALRNRQLAQARSTGGTGWK